MARRDWPRKSDLSQPRITSRFSVASCSSFFAIVCVRTECHGLRRAGIAKQWEQSGKELLRGLASNLLDLVPPAARARRLQLVAEVDEVELQIHHLTK